MSRAVRHSLRLRALALVFLFNSAVFAALGVVLVRNQVEASQRTEELWTEDLVATIDNTIATEGLKVASILRWPSWRFIDDALLVDRHLEESFTGTMEANGIQLNPVGLSARPASFDRESVLRAVFAAMHRGSPVSALGGRAVPIQGKSGIWGGLWYRAKKSQEVDYLVLLERMLPWFALSTVLLTAATFFALRRMVLDPVERLAEGARRVRSGDFDVRLEVPERRDELADLVRSFNDMTSTVAGFNQRLSEEVRQATEKARMAEAAAMRERRLAAMGELAAGIAHEINNPLGGLQNAVADLKRADLPDQRRSQYLDLLKSGLERIGATVSRLRRFTPRDSPFEPLDLAAVVQDAVALVQHRAQLLGVELVAPPENDVPAVPGVRNDISHAVLNLLVNALDALEEGGTSDPRGPRIVLDLGQRDGGVFLVVRDNGPGAEPDVLDRLGDLFFTTKEVGRGTGLGLALVYSAVRRHHGQLLLTSEPGRFFQVELFLPGRAEAERRA